MKKNDWTFRIVEVGMLAALHFVLSAYVSVSTGTMKFTLDGLPILLAAFLYGPVDGALVGGIGSFLSQLVSYGLTATTPLWVLPAIVRGLLVGLCVKACKYRPTPVTSCVIIAVSSLVVTVLNTFVIWADAKIFGYYTDALVLLTVLFRFLSSVITAVLYCAVLLPQVKALKENGFGMGLGGSREHK